MMPIQRVLERLPGKRRDGAGYEARCPVAGHGRGQGDRRPSLKVTEGDDGRVLLKCRAGCATTAVVEALGLSMADLFPTSPNGNGHENLVTRPTASWHIKDAEAECRKVEDMDTAFGMRLRWTLWLLKISAEASGWTSMSPSTKARAYQWAQILNGGPIDPATGWRPETLEGERCWVKVEAYEDSKGEPHQPKVWEKWLIGL